MGRLDVTIIGCKNLENVQSLGTIDPYVIVTVGENKFQTQVADNSTDPKWNETFKFHIADPNTAQVKLQVWNHNVVSDDYLGEYSFNVAMCVKGEPKTTWNLLKQAKGNPEVGITLLAHDFGSEPAAADNNSISKNNNTQQQQQVQPQPQPQPQQQQQPAGFWFPQQQQGGGMIPMPTGPAALNGWVPPIPPACMVNPAAGRQPLTVCRHGHGLTLTPVFDSRAQTLWCDLCFHQCVGGSGAKQCRTCDMDICQRCQAVYSSLPPPPKCPRGHDLRPNQGREGTWGCDHCQKSGKNGSMRCATCDFDICDKCFAYYIANQWKHLQ